MSHYDVIRQFSKMLQNIEKWLDRAEAHATAKKYEVDVLAASRLAPDAFTLAQQVQAACDQAKFAAAYLTGSKAPAHPDTEKTVAELRQRIAACMAFLATVEEKDFAGSAERKVAPPWLDGKWFHGEDYVEGLAIPNFYFHVTMVYAILRHNGVDVGKMDFIGGLQIQDA
ncbi:DUF1993 domain-containing protein [Solimonas sp. K1W22B-7]|uniref:DUF1993 domain-containing protein n=1 Tax=Solimonas sp. K1W22B-7 TaxID=2303331 RepID=UPI000E32E857|nr:DUF1993 domain-containing protein [Solimonas sp. K1W22B-7]AXQ28106.1 DUF1993 domain-containing protein [Solimonas sp. K1W22B-7]